MKIKFHGHSFVQIESSKYSIVIDPFITGNPKAIVRPSDIKCDFIVLSHGHGDHFGDTIEISRNNNALVLATYELANYAESKGVRLTHTMNLGGGYSFPFGRVKLTLAHHSSTTPDGAYAGDPAGILLYLDGKTFFHAGDTALFYDMKLIGETNSIDYAFLPIGDNFTMGIDDAVKAAEFLNAKKVIPIHYNTFDVIKADAEEFRKKIQSIGKECIVMNPGDKIEA
jgi:L-ascorbate metabolism protein UlaG (beta-lactamase superfamily)